MFDPTQLSFDDLLRRFFAEATPNICRVQYQSAVWAQDAAQRVSALRIAKEMGKDGIPVLDATDWHDAEDYHQKYYEKQVGPRACRRL